VRQDDSEAMEKQLIKEISDLQAEIDKMSPNMKAIDRLDEVQTRLDATSAEFDEGRKAAKEARETFNDVKQRRSEAFNKAYSHISKKIDEVYKDLTKGKAAPMGGVAYLSLEDPEEPYLYGVKYHAMPPMKRFRDMEQLSGGEKTMAALALLFAIQRWVVSMLGHLSVQADLDTAMLLHLSLCWTRWTPRWTTRMLARLLNSMLAQYRKA
jgi:structural maintenance of chromosome 1